MTDLYSLFQVNCQALVQGSGEEVGRANDWFLSFVEQPLLCWSFSGEVISQAHHRFEVEASEAQRRGDPAVTIMASSHLQESFFAIKLLQNVALAPVQWSQVPEDQRMQIRQLLAGLLFDPHPHALHRTSLLRNQLSCTLATLLAVSTLDTSQETAACAYSGEAADSVDLAQVCEENILPVQQSMLSLIETVNDKCVLSAVIRTMHDLPAVATSLLRAKQNFVLEKFPQHFHGSVSQSLACGYSSLSTYRHVLIACFEKTSSVLSEQIPCFSNLSDVSAAIVEITVSCELLYATLDSLMVWTEHTSSSTSWLSTSDLTLSSEHNAASNPSPASSVLGKMESTLSAMCALLMHVNSEHFTMTDRSPLETLVLSLQKCFHKIFELFGYVLLVSSTDMSTSLYEHYMSQSPCNLEHHQHCAGVLHVFRCVSVVVDWLITSGKKKFHLDVKLQTFLNTAQVQVSLGCLKECLYATISEDINLQFVKLLQGAISSSALNLNSCDDDEADGDVDELGFIFVFLAEVVSQLVEKHLDTLILLDGSSLSPHRDEISGENRSCDQNINILSNMIYFCLLLPNMYAKVTILEALGTVLAACSTLNSRKHSNQKQQVMRTFLQSLFFGNSDGRCPDLAAGFHFLLVLSQSGTGNCADQEELSTASQNLELRMSCAEVCRCMWRLGVSASSPLGSEAPVLLSTLLERHIYPVCNRLHAVYSLYANGLQDSTHSEREVLVQLQEASVTAMQLEQKLVSVLYYLSVFVEDTVEHFCLDEDVEEDDEDDEDESRAVSDKRYGISFTLYCRAWLMLLASLTDQLLSLRQNISYCIKLGASRGCPVTLPDLFAVLKMFGLLWESCPHVVKAFDPFLHHPHPGPAPGSSVTPNVGSPEDVRVYSKLLPGTWDLLQYALNLSTMDHSHTTPRSSDTRNITSIVMAFQRIAESCKYASCASAFQLISCLQLFVRNEDEFSKQTASHRPQKALCGSSSLMSSKGGSQYYRMLATYLQLIGLDGEINQDTVKEEALQVVFQSIICPLEDIFARISQVGCGSDKSIQQQLQFEVLSENLTYLFALFSRLKGFILPLSADQVFSKYVLKLHDFVFNMLRVVSELYVFAMSPLSCGGVDGVLHLELSSEEDAGADARGERRKQFAALHDCLVSVLCAVMDSHMSASLVSAAVQRIEQTLQLVQSSKLIQLVTVIIRWSVSDSSDASDIHANHEESWGQQQQVAQVVARIMYHCKVELNRILSPRHPSSGCTSEFDMDKEWLGIELATTWRLIRQMCSSAPLLFLHSYSYSEHCEASKDTVLSNLMDLCVSVVKIATSSSSSSCCSSLTEQRGLSLHLRPLCTLFDQLRTQTLSMCLNENMGRRFAALFIPSALEMLAVLLSYILYGDSNTNTAISSANNGISNKDLKQLFSQVYLLLLDALGAPCCAFGGRVTVTSELLETVFWPFCSYVFHGPPCLAMQAKVMSMHHIPADSLPCLPADTETEMRNGVFFKAPLDAPTAGAGTAASGVNEGQLQYISAKTATEITSQVLLKHVGGRQTKSTQFIRNTVNALCELQTTFQVI